MLNKYKVGIRAKANAFPIMRYSPATIPAPKRMAIAAPNPAPDVMPKVKGLASRFLKIPYTVPAIASHVPAKMPIMIHGNLKFQTTISLVVSTF